MRGTATLENVIGKVHEISVNHSDEIVPVHEMEFDNLNKMLYNGGIFSIGEGIDF